jgi:hypothetical protein
MRSSHDETEVNAYKAVCLFARMFQFENPSTDFD